MPAMRYCFIVNPQARNGRSGGKLNQLRAEIKRQGIVYNYLVAEGLAQAQHLSQEANRDGYEVVVAVGGDGTINRVINGFYDAQGKRLSSARLGVVHTGTSPDLCRTYRISTDIATAVATVVNGIVRPISIGRILFAPEFDQHPPRDCVSRSTPAYFVCCANIGLGAQLARLANGGIRKYAGDFLGTFVSLLRVLGSYRPRSLDVTLDGKNKVVPRAYNLSVGKTVYIASGIKVRHSLGNEDRRFYVLTVSNLSCTRLLPVLWSLYSGRPIRPSNCLSLDYAHEVTLGAGNESADVEFDGDPAGHCPCHIDAATEPLDLMVDATVC
jgi:diacylglycerol kinase family enzyme